MIKPTVGRVVWYWNGGKSEEQPRVALIAHVWGDRMVNLGGFDQNGAPFSATSVTLRQPEDEAPAYSFCEWMPYQQGQAAKTEALEKKLAEKA